MAFVLEVTSLFEMGARVGAGEYPKNMRPYPRWGFDLVLPPPCARLGTSPVPAGFFVEMQHFCCRRLALHLS